MSDFLFLPKLPNGLGSEVVACRYTQNVQSKFDENLVDYQFATYKADPDQRSWKLIDTKNFDGDFCIFNDQEYDLQAGELLVIVPIPLGFHPQDHLEQLPTPLSKKISRAPVNERGTIRIYSKHERTNYQGEYPYNMSLIPKGSLISFPTFIQETDAILKCVVINVQCNINTWNSAPLYLIDYKQKKVIETYEMSSNSTTTIEIPIEFQNSLYLYGPNMAGIPLYVHHNNDYSELSLEHTHPPSEYFYGADKINLQKEIKKNWIRLANEILSEAQ